MSNHKQPPITSGGFFSEIFLHFRQVAGKPPADRSQSLSSGAWPRPPRAKAQPPGSLEEEKNAKVEVFLVRSNRKNQEDHRFCLGFYCLLESKHLICLTNNRQVFWGCSSLFIPWKPAIQRFCSIAQESNSLDSSGCCGGETQKYHETSQT